MSRWEYKCEKNNISLFDPNGIASGIAGLQIDGEEGWKLTSIVMNNQPFVILFFKRLIDNINVNVYSDKLEELGFQEAAQALRNEFL